MPEYIVSVESDTVRPLYGHGTRWLAQMLADAGIVGATVRFKGSEMIRYRTVEDPPPPPVPRPEPTVIIESY